VEAAREEAISYAAYRLLSHRFASSPGRVASQAQFDALLERLGYDPSFRSTDYRNGSPAALGNHIGEYLIRFGLQDGSNESGGYASPHYRPVNPRLTPIEHGTSGIIDPNRWQELNLKLFIGQSGIIGSPVFVTPEWGRVVPFALPASALTRYPRDGTEYWVYHDPGAPPYLDTLGVGPGSADYRWSFELDAIWSSHLDPTDGVMWDISPASIGNIQTYPSNPAEYRQFYDLFGGGDTGEGRTLNPKTGAPYAPQIVPRGDYARVLAEFWADGPASETPPGHWFTILNGVTDHPQFERRLEGQGPVVDALQWDVKAYLTLGGAMHDAAITAWGIKGWYDYVRPISAVRCMAERGQCADAGLPGFDLGGLSLIPGYLELVQPGDTLAGPAGENVDKVKLRAWRGPRAMTDPTTQRAGVGWMLAEDWWPYQRATFVTPPFAGYVSGHSTFSRTAAVVMERLTGDPYFPGGLGEFHAARNDFLRVEQGPSVDVTLQWATYRDASDQCSLSRIWTGFHPPADDIPGRHLGEIVGAQAFERAMQHFGGTAPDVLVSMPVRLYPNPMAAGGLVTLEINRPADELKLSLYDVQGRLVRSETRSHSSDQRFVSWAVGDGIAGVYFLRVSTAGWESTARFCVLK
jgi:hypothetical protein